MGVLMVPSYPAAEEDFQSIRSRMVQEQLERRGIKNSAVLQAMRKVPRHKFVPAPYQDLAYSDRPLPIGEEQTISQPYIVALMSEAASIQPGEKVLEVGTGSGYQAAVLAELTNPSKVHSIEILPGLGKQARTVLDQLNYKEVQTRVGDGYLGWPEAAPFDAILVTAAAKEVPQPLLDQLAKGGRLVIPVGSAPAMQTLRVITCKGEDYDTQDISPVAFVPLVRSPKK